MFNISNYTPGSLVWYYYKYYSDSSEEAKKTVCVIKSINQIDVLKFKVYFYDIQCNEWPDDSGDDFYFNQNIGLSMKIYDGIYAYLVSLT